MFDGEVDQLGVGVQVERLHDLVLVELDGPGRDVELRRDFLRRAPLGQELEDFLPTISWPGDVVGCAAVVERLVLPPAADGHVPDDPAAAAEYASEHPDRQEVRIVAGVTRHGASYCALRLRAHDDDMAVMGGADLVPSLLALLRATMEDETEDPTDPAGETP